MWPRSVPNGAGSGSTSNGMWFASRPAPVMATSAPRGCAPMSAWSTCTLVSSKCVGRYIPGLALRVLAQLQPPDLAAMHLVRTVGEAQRARVRPHERERELLGDTTAAVDLHRPVDHLQRHVRHRHLDLRDRLL